MFRLRDRDDSDGDSLKTKDGVTQDIEKKRHCVISVSIVCLTGGYPFALAYPVKVGIAIHVILFLNSTNWWQSRRHGLLRERFLSTRFHGLAIP